MSVETAARTPPAPISPSVDAILRRGSLVCGAVVAATALLVLVGWAWDIAELKRLHPSSAPMKANVAVCLVLLGASLAALGADLWAERRRSLVRLLASACFAIAALTLLQDLFGWDFAIDELLFTDDEGGTRPGRMPINAAILLVLLGAAGIRLDDASLGASSSQWFGLSALVGALVAICGYLYGVDALYAIPGFGALSVDTAACVLLAGLGLLAAQPRGGVMLVLSTDTVGAMLARRLFPVIVIVPIAIGWIRLYGEEHGLYGTAVGVTLFTVTTIVTIGTIAWFISRRLIDAELVGRHAHEELAESRRHLSTTLRSLGDGVIACDRTGSITLMNPVAEKLTGWTSAEARGRSLDEVFSTINEDSGAPLESPVQRVLRDGALVDLADRTAIVARDGRTVPIANSGAPLVRDDGGVEGVVLVFRDVSAERLAKGALQRSQQLLQIISDNSSAVIYAKDLDGRYLLVNRRFSELFHISADQVLGKTDYDLFPKEEADVFRDMDRRVAAAGVALTEEEPARVDGDTHTYISVKCPLTDETGRIYGIFGISTDITDRKRAEHALRANEERTRSILETALDAVVTMDAAGTITGWSRQAERTFGWSREQAMGRPMAELIIPERFRDRHRVGLQRFLDTGEGPALNTRLELSALHHNGIEFPIELSITSARLGNDVSFSAFVRDITERQRTERALVESQQHYQALAESLPHLVWTCRPDGYCDFLSRQWVEYTGRPAHEQLGYGWAEQLHPDDRDHVQTEWAAAVDRGDSFDVEFRIRRADGAYRWFKTRAVPLHDDTGNVVKWFGSNTDINDFKESEQRLQAQLERLNLLDQLTRAIGERHDLRSILHIVIRSLEDLLPLDFCCVCSYDRADETLSVTAVGFKSERLATQLGMPERARFEVGENGLARCVRGQLIYEPDVTRHASPFAHRLGRAGLRALVAAPLAVESTVFGVLIAARHDERGFTSPECEFLRQLSEHVALATHHAELYTALQRAYDDLRLTQQAVMQQERLKALGQMASGIAHDINNAISPVVLYTDTLLETEPRLSIRGREYLMTIQRAIQDVAQTVARMREFYREREPQLLTTPVNLNRLVRESLELTRARWSDMALQRGVVIDLSAQLTPGDPVVRGVESELREALINLIFNAVDAMPEGGRLSVRTRTSGPAERTESVAIEISDTGVGMDAETRRRCLEPFFTTKGERGTGLGLAMVYGMVQRHGGDIEVASAPGEGTTITLWFTHLVGAREPATVVPERQLPPRVRILLIDDDPLLLRSLRNVLEADGHLVDVASGGQAGIERFEKANEEGKPYGIVITDLGMPYVDGRQVATAIKAISPTPVILLTGWGQRLVDDADVPLHVDRVLNKPPRLPDLRQAVTELMSAPS